MIYPEQLKIDTGRTVGGDFIRVIHLPTNITKTQAPPINNNHEFYIKKLILEIENDLIEKGLIEYISENTRE
jgi:hypothetical protein